MRYFFFYFTLIIIISACNKSFYKHSNVPIEGKYFNTKSIVYIFVKIENDIAYIDVLRYTKGPEYYYSDTIIISDNQKRKWQGELVSLYEENRRLIIEAPTHDFYGDIKKDILVKTVLKLENDKYDALYNNFKNQTLIHRATMLIDSYDLKSGEIYRKLIINHQMSKKGMELEHKDFLIEFEKFEKELFKELELLKIQE